MKNRPIHARLGIIGRRRISYNGAGVDYLIAIMVPPPVVVAVRLLCQAAATRWRWRRDAGVHRRLVTILPHLRAPAPARQQPPSGARSKTRRRHRNTAPDAQQTLIDCTLPRVRLLAPCIQWSHFSVLELALQWTQTQRCMT